MNLRAPATRAAAARLRVPSTRRRAVLRKHLGKLRWIEHLRQIGQLINHDIRLDPRHRVMQGALVEYVEDDGLRAGTLKGRHLVGIPRRAGDEMARTGQKRDKPASNHARRTCEKNLHNDPLTPRPSAVPSPRRSWPCALALPRVSLFLPLPLPPARARRNWRYQLGVDARNIGIGLRHFLGEPRALGGEIDHACERQRCNSRRHDELDSPCGGASERHFRRRAQAASQIPTSFGSVGTSCREALDSTKGNGVAGGYSSRRAPNGSH